MQHRTQLMLATGWKLRSDQPLMWKSQFVHCCASHDARNWCKACFENHSDCNICPFIQKFVPGDESLKVVLWEIASLEALMWLPAKAAAGQGKRQQSSNHLAPSVLFPKHQSLLKKESQSWIWLRAHVRTESLMKNNNKEVTAKSWGLALAQWNKKNRFCQKASFSRIILWHTCVLPEASASVKWLRWAINKGEPTFPCHSFGKTKRLPCLMLLVGAVPWLQKTEKNKQQPGCWLVAAKVKRLLLIPRHLSSWCGSHKKLQWSKRDKHLFIFCAILLFDQGSSRLLIVHLQCKAACRTKTIVSEAGLSLVVIENEMCWWFREKKEWT